ncbi:MAG: Stealth CR1 domain-containing protein, partial [Rickettsiales bacterium]|nr:Stealth CR1 domain-containing protein [Rickettsiales bacterium]
MDPKVDLVYTWVDGNDPVWQKERNKFFLINKRDFHKSRFRDNNELKYSLRSVSKFASFINNIFIVTHKQKPSFLNLSHPKIHIIDHSQILPSEAIPNYNSIAIEMCIDNIPNLQEKYIYFNDDFFFGNYVKSSDFFEGAQPIITMKKHHFKYKNYYDNLQLLHTPTPFLKSFVKEIKQEYEEAVQKTICCQIRGSGEQFHREMFNKIAVKRNKVKLMLQSRFPTHLWFRFKRLFALLHTHTHTHTH